MTHDLPRIDNELALLAELVPLDGQRIIELGCGAARLLRDLLLGFEACLLYTSPSPRDRTRSRMPSSA